MQNATCDMQHATHLGGHNRRLVTRIGACSMQHATCNLRHAALVPVSIPRHASVSKCANACGGTCMHACVRPSVRPSVHLSMLHAKHCPPGSCPMKQPAAPARRSRHVEAEQKPPGLGHPGRFICKYPPHCAGTVACIATLQQHLELL